MATLSANAWFAFLGPIAMPQASGPYRDWDAYIDLLGRLRATREFDEVAWAEDASQVQFGEDVVRACTLSPGYNDRMMPQGNRWRRLRVCQYRLTIQVIAGTLQEAWEECNRLLSVANNAVGQVSLGGFTLDEHSTLTSNDFGMRMAPERTVRAMGQFAYVVNLKAGGLRETFDNNPRGQ